MYCDYSPEEVVDLLFSENLYCIDEVYVSVLWHFVTSTLDLNE